LKDLEKKHLLFGGQVDCMLKLDLRDVERSKEEDVIRENEESILGSLTRNIGDRQGAREGWERRWKREGPS
jgi:hypothetical protein